MLFVEPTDVCFLTCAVCPENEPLDVVLEG